jgi:hypothetical protein
MFRGFQALLVALALTVVSAEAAVAAVPDTPQRTASVNGSVYSVVYVGTTVYLAGTFTTATDSSGTVTRNNAAAINASTGQLLSWNPNTNGEVRALSVVPGGIALGGSFTSVGGKPHTNLAVVDASTGAPTSFSGSTNRRVRALATGPTGRLYVGGEFTSVSQSASASGQTRAGLAAFDGNTLTSWAPKASGGAVLTLQAANGWIFAGGTFTAINSVSGSGFLAALNPTSSALVSSWNPPIAIPVHATDVSLTTLYAAADGTGGHLEAFALTTGANLWTVTTDGGVQAVKLLGSDVYFGGHFDHVGTAVRHKLGLVNTSGALQSWAPDANSNQGVFSLASNGSVLGAGGAFTKFKAGTINQPHFAQFG